MQVSSLGFVNVFKLIGGGFQIHEVGRMVVFYFLVLFDRGGMVVFNFPTLADRGVVVVLNFLTLGDGGGWAGKNVQIFADIVELKDPMLRYLHLRLMTDFR